MSVCDFFIDIKTNENVISFLEEKYRSNSLYKTAFSFNRLNVEIHNGFNVGIQSVIDNFLPANHLIYEFLSSMIDDKVIYIKSNGIERIFDFSLKSDFIGFMYNTWEKQIDLAHSQYGVLLLDIQKYWRTRNKLCKKYYKKIVK